MKKMLEKKKMYIIYFLIIVVLYNGFKTQVPIGTGYTGTINENAKLKFIYDLTYENNGETITEQEIFNHYLNIIENAEEFIIIDMFLFNDDYNRNYSYKNIVETVTNKLIEQREKNSDIDIIFITDEINNFYGSYENKFLKKLSDNNIDVVITDLSKTRDSNPIYAGIWRSFFNWIDIEGDGYLPNVFSSDSQKVTLPAYLKLLNFKANHRKVIISEKMALVSSANNHDASANHSNIGFLIEDSKTINDLVTAEKVVAEFSGYEFKKNYKGNVQEELETGMTAQVLTEKAILNALLDEIKSTENGDKIYLAMFYIGHREVINQLIKASERGVQINIVLDPNKDAFGVKKAGIPNRQVASELTKKSNINIQWYNTTGEQYHSKMTSFFKQNEFVVIGGSANYTRRNLDNYNLELCVKVTTKKDSQLEKEIEKYFDKILNNESGTFTIDYGVYEDNSFLKKLIYRFQEFSGFSTF